MEEWLEIELFPGYSVSNMGRVRNEYSGRILTLLINQHGTAHVGLCRGGMQYKRSVTLLVAKAFLVPHPREAFDTPVNLDGDRTNNAVGNLIWRPRWFAVKYLQQFMLPPAGFRVPIEEVKTKEWFNTSWDAAIKFGLLDKEIMVATINRTYVWPTYQRFRVIDTR